MAVKHLKKVEAGNQNPRKVAKDQNMRWLMKNCEQMGSMLIWLKRKYKSMGWNARGLLVFNLNFVI